MLGPCQNSQGGGGMAGLPPLPLDPPLFYSVHLTDMVNSSQRTCSCSESATITLLQLIADCASEKQWKIGPPCIRRASARYFTGEVCGTAVLSAVNGRSRDRFSVVGDTPAVTGGVVALFISVTTIWATPRNVDIVTSSLFFNRQTSFFYTPAPSRPLCTAQQTL